MASYRVLKAHGLWRVGDIRTGSALSMRQGVRAGMLELVVEPAKAAPTIGVSRRKKKADDGEAAV